MLHKKYEMNANTENGKTSVGHWKYYYTYIYIVYLTTISLLVDCITVYVIIYIFLPFKQNFILDETYITTLVHLTHFKIYIFYGIHIKKIDIPVIYDIYV